jgi:hypothetical protein
MFGVQTYGVTGVQQAADTEWLAPPYTAATQVGKQPSQDTLVYKATPARDQARNTRLLPSTRQARWSNLTERATQGET